MERAEVDKKTAGGSSSEEELFGIIEYAIQVAASKYPQEFSTQKSKVMQLLSAQSSMTTRALSTDHHIKNVEEPAQKKKMIIKLKINGGVLKKDCDHKQAMGSVKVSPTTVTQEVIKKENEKEKEIYSKSLKLQASKRKIAQRYMEAKKARKTVQVLDLCNLPRQQEFRVEKKAQTKPRTFHKKL